MIANYMGMALGQPDPQMMQGFAGPMAVGGTPPLSLSNPGFKNGPPVMRPMAIDPATGLPIAGGPMQPPHIAGPDFSLGGWDGVNDKMRYFAQQMQQNRMMRHAMRDEMHGPMGGKGGGGGGFGQLIHSIFGGGGGAPGGMGGFGGMAR